MKRLGIVFLVTLVSVAVLSANSYSQYVVCPEDTCYLACPSGDASFCYCILYNNEPLQLHPSLVFLTIECPAGLLVCPGESLTKPGYLRQDECHHDPLCGAEYCWFFQLGGCCLEAHIILHLGDFVPIFDEWVVIKTPDFNADGIVNLADYSLLGDKMGTTDPCYDLNCDGIVDMLDADIFNLHYTHSCEDMIGVEEGSWGSIKSIYKE
ncbi:MAG: hypothetical protein JSV33_03625 [bacterium]|nr:MAG: hypothetical protein JSV33_03625 [bacterium]